MKGKGIGEYEVFSFYGIRREKRWKEGVGRSFKFEEREEGWERRNVEVLRDLDVKSVGVGFKFLDEREE